MVSTACIASSNSTVILVLIYVFSKKIEYIFPGMVTVLKNVFFAQLNI